MCSKCIMVIYTETKKIRHSLLLGPIAHQSPLPPHTHTPFNTLYATHTVALKVFNPLHSINTHPSSILIIILM